MENDYGYWATLLRCVDGDTFDAEVDLGFRVYVRHRFRMLSLDTPERGQPGYLQCRDKLDRLIRTIYSNDEEQFWIESHKTGKYGRWLARIPHPHGDTLPDVSVMLNEYMTDNGYHKLGGR